MRHATTHTHHSSGARRAGFTLVELMVAITILLVLTIITAKVAIDTIEKDRVPKGARQLQSYLEGARNRAIYSAQTLNPGPRGIRFLRDPNGPTKDLIDANGNTVNPTIKVPMTVTSMVYIGPPQKYFDGAITIGTSDPDGTITSRRKIKIYIEPPNSNTTYDSKNTPWSKLELRKLLLSGARIEILRSSGNFYTIENRNTKGYPGDWFLTKDYPSSYFPKSVDNYLLELEPAVLPNQEPRLLPRNVVIDMSQFNFKDPDKKHSKIPPFWSFNSHFRNRMDILFSPQGTIVGRAAIGGYIHLVVTDVVDMEHGRFTGDPSKEADERIITINTRTGKVSVHSVNPTNAAGKGDPFLFSETGEEL